MKIIKIIDGFVTNSSSSGTTIVVALKKGKDLGEMLKKIGLSSEFASRFEDKDGFNKDTLKRWVEDAFLDSNIYDLQEEYEILQASIITDAFGDEIEFIDHSDFRKRFYDKIRIEKLPLKLVDKNFILLHSIGDDLEYEHEVKEDTMNRTWLLIEQLKNPHTKIEPRQPKTYEVRNSLEQDQKEVLEEFERLIETRIPVVKTINIGSIEDFLGLEEKDRTWRRGNLIPEIEGFKTEDRHIIALGFHFRMNNQDPKILPVSIRKLSRLKILDLCFYSWIDTPEILGNPKSVEILKFPSFCNFETAPESIGKMTSLKRLTIRDCKGKILPDSLGNLKQLEVLQLKNNNSNGLFSKERSKVPTMIPETIRNLESLIILDLSYNNIDTLPDSLGNLNSLQYLNLSGNYILKLPKTFGNLRKLKELHMYGNQLVFLPELFGDLESLEKCNLSSNSLTNLPNSIGNLKLLKNLNLSNNHLQVLPRTLGNLETLEDLNLEKNELESLPEIIGTLNSLRSLNLDTNKLKTLPESIGDIVLLDSLRLSNCHLKELPESIGNLKNLQHLSITSNPLKKLPDSIGKIHSLKRLFIYSNELEELPETIGNMASLEEILMGKNPLKKLPSSLLNLKNLKSLWIGGDQRNTFQKDPESLKILNELKKNEVYLRID